MSVSPKDCCILNGGAGAWAFEPLAEHLSSILGVDISATPRSFNYLLHLETFPDSKAANFFIPLESIQLAADKRLLAEVFNRHEVPIPTTALLDTFSEVMQFIHTHPKTEWCLKYPTSCGASGHRLISENSIEPNNWPCPFVVQEFIRLKRPEVYRIYCISGDLFGWVVRRFPTGAKASPWVAHAQGARYVRLNVPPSEALKAAKSALKATGLWNTFGCVDLLQRPTGAWVVLEVGTDGLANHVDREIGDPDLETEMNQRTAESFWKWANHRFTTSGSP